MPQCNDCKKENARMSWWDKVCDWLFNRFSKQITDLAADRFTQGFGAGYAKGFKHSKDTKPAPVIELRTCVDPSQVIRAKVDEKGTVQVSLGNAELSKDAIAQLKGEVDLLEKMRLWSVMQETVREMAIEDSIKKSTKWEDALSGKLMVHNLGVMNSILETIKRVKMESAIITPKFDGKL